MANYIQWIQKNIEHKGLRGNRLDLILCFSVKMLAKGNQPLLLRSTLCSDPPGERHTPWPRLVP
jgi:hypothetical protein